MIVIASINRFIRERLDPEAALGLRLTVGLAVAAVVAWAFAWLLEEVLDAESLVRWDGAAIQWMHAHQTPLGVRVFEVVTRLGFPGVVIVGLAVAVYLFRRRARLLLTGWIAANAGGWVLDLVLKLSVQRARPPFASAFFHGHSSSFPSGHAMSGTICYSMLAFIITRLVPLARWQEIALYAGTTLLALLIGLSRVYLTVHYPSDVIGGHLAGVAWLAVCITGVEIGQRADVRNRARHARSAAGGGSGADASGQGVAIDHGRAR